MFRTSEHPYYQSAGSKGTGKPTPEGVVVIERQARYRIALLAIVVSLIAMWFVFGGNSSSVIVIEFGISPRDLIGTEVVIDGEVVGTLQRMGSRTQTGFKVSDGDHIVTLRHPEFRTRQTRVTSGFGGQRVLLVADIQSSSRNGQQETYIVLNR
jgi:hypothetical protein